MSSLSRAINKYDFRGKVALVTGSSSGIGAAIAVQFAKYGADVTITGRNAVNLGKVADDMKKVSGKEPLQLVGDVVESGFLAKLVTETVAKFGQLDFLINNAGAGTPSGNYSNANLLEQFDKIMALNTRSVVELTQLSIPHLEKTKGNIVNISSIAALRPCGILVYSTSKAALDMITKCSAQELGPKGIRVNSINPGPVRTNFFASIGMGDELLDMYIPRTAIGRVGIPDDIANLASFLVSDDAANITGSILVSDSGVVINNK